MRQITLALNLLISIFFIGFLAYTFVGQQHLKGRARQFVTEKTIAYSQPLVDVVEEGMNSPLVKKLLNDDQEAAINQQIRQYRQGPAAYISDLTRQKKLPPAPRRLNPLFQKVSETKKKIRTFYDNTLAALILDLRIFAFSNLCAALIALALTYWSPRKIRHSLVWFSFLIFVAVLYCSYLYVDGLSFFRILLGAHLGWTYPLLLCVAVVCLFLEYPLRRRINERKVEEEVTSV
ncbi:hypothetical protein Pan153_63210 [Gimesia panareensis]|uniref:Uncharacterized protein n=1 Tax=Gimesia panareensis TaxID=2527978 RepID=A0A518FZ69_9PLAN|nr:hypothetical protein [Gimesia panareensis]QDV21631.1 hypothetical protein Pan153_63210 [Gimesia panareensis]